jgi:hypothetical protein
MLGLILGALAVLGLSEEHDQIKIKLEEISNNQQDLNKLKKENEILQKKLKAAIDNTKRK